jgi:hypothetical protein
MHYFELRNIQHFVLYLLPAVLGVLIFAIGLARVHFRHEDDDARMNARAHHLCRWDRGAQRPLSAGPDSDHRRDRCLGDIVHHFLWCLGSQNMNAGCETGMSRPRRPQCLQGVGDCSSDGCFYPVQRRAGLLRHRRPGATRLGLPADQRCARRIGVFLLSQRAFPQHVRGAKGE